MALCNRSLFANILRKYWPLWVLYCVLSLMVLASTNVFIGPMGKYISMSVVSFLCAISAPLVVMASFSYLFFPKAACAAHALPVKRTALFGSSYLAGLLMLATPYLIYIPYLASGGFPLLLLNTLIIMLCYYSLCVFLAAVTGHIIAVPSLYIIILAAPAMAAGIVNVFGASMYWGVQTFVNWGDWSLPSLLGRHITGDIFMGYGTYVGIGSKATIWHFILLACPIVLTAAAGLLSRLRPVETAGELSSLKPLRPLLKYGAAAFFTCGFALMCIPNFIRQGTMRDNLPLLLLFFAIGLFIGVFGMEMLLSKSFKVFAKSWKGYVISLVLVSALVTGVRYDVFGVESHIPQTDSVESASVTWSPADFPKYDYSYSKRAYEERGSDPSFIEDVRALHGLVLSEKEALLSAYVSDSNDYANILAQYIYYQHLSVTIKYKMKDGGTMERRYTGITNASDNVQKKIFDALMTVAENPGASRWNAS